MSKQEKKELSPQEIRTAELEKALKMSELQKQALEIMIGIAEEQMKIDLSKYRDSAKS